MLSLGSQVRGKFAVCIDSTMTDKGASYNPDSHTMYFKDLFNVNDGNLEHELFHAYQNNFYSGGISKYSTGTQTGYSNIEFEFALYLDIVRTGMSPQAMNLANTATKAEYITWVNGLRSTHPTTYSQFGDKYFYYLEIWKATRSQYNKPADYTLKPDALMNVFINSSCN